jgi:hypothetical protein
MSDRAILQGIKEYTSGSLARELFDHAHWEIHQGNSYIVSVGSFTATMASGAYVDLGFKTPDSGEAHVVMGYTAKDAAHMSVYVDCNWSGATGTVLPAINRNLQSSNTSFLLNNAVGATFVPGGMMKGMSGFSGALAYERWTFGAKFQTTQSSRGRAEVILQTGTQYGIRLWSDAASNSVQLELDWYEES